MSAPEPIRPGERANEAELRHNFFFAKAMARHAGPLDLAFETVFAYEYLKQEAARTRRERQDARQNPVSD